MSSLKRRRVVADQAPGEAEEEDILKLRMLLKQAERVKREKKIQKEKEGILGIVDTMLTSFEDVKKAAATSAREDATKAKDLASEFKRDMEKNAQELCDIGSRMVEELNRIKDNQQTLYNKYRDLLTGAAEKEKARERIKHIELIEKSQRKLYKDLAERIATTLSNAQLEL